MLHANIPGEAEEDGPSAWVRAAYMSHLHEVPGSWL